MHSGTADDRKKPFEIARETLKRLTERKLAPTPVHYKALYNEIAGIPTVEHFPLNELRAIAAALQPKTPGQVRQKGLLESAIDRMHWDGVQTALIAYAGYVPATAIDAPVAVPLAPRASEPPATPEITADFLAQIGRMLAFMQPALGQADKRFTEQTEQLIQALKDPGSPVTQVKQLLAQYSHRLSFAAEDQVEIKASLLKLLNLMFENIADLGVDDHWLQGQMQALRDASVPPLTLRRLDEVEELLKDVIAKQKEAKQKPWMRKKKCARCWLPLWSVCLSCRRRPGTSSRNWRKARAKSRPPNPWPILPRCSKTWC